MGVCGLACGQRVKESWESVKYSLFMALHPVGFRTATWPVQLGAYVHENGSMLVCMCLSVPTA